METHGGWAGKILKILEWGMVFAYINLLWFAFTLLGLIVFGLMPATVSLFSIIRKWYCGQRDIKIFPTFWQSYKRDFVKSNLLGLVLAAIGIILYIDFYFLMSMSHWFSMVLLVFVVVLMFLYTVVLVHIFPVFVHFDIKFWDYLKFSLTIGLSHLGRSLLLIFGSLLIVYLLLSYPGTIPFFSISSLAAYMMWISLKTYEKIVVKNQVKTQR